MIIFEHGEGVRYIVRDGDYSREKEGVEKNSHFPPQVVHERGVRPRKEAT